MEDVVGIPSRFWQGRSVLITGHTGFKGAWLTLWLSSLGASVHGYALDPPTTPSLFDAARIPGRLSSDVRADLLELARLKTAVSAARPEVVFHLAAQPLVRESYRDPLGTFASNVIGTANVLEAARDVDSVRAIVVITTDKVYENRESMEPYRESDALGGHDPYSASKAAAEIVTASYRSSFLGGASHPARVATARAGNVIGGGDWAADRLVPDCLRAFASGEPVRLRFPGSVRPWQHVLEPLAGYQLLAERLLAPVGATFATGWNFGPDARDDASVGAFAQSLAELWGVGARVVLAPSTDNPHEAGLLRLDSTKALTALHWRPQWRLQRALEETVAWHHAWKAGADMADVTLGQIRAYEESKAS
jgi:CDP-glucose 4,6-dehydratase